MGLFAVAKVTDVPVGSKKKVEAQKIEFVLANIEGKFYALANKCPHLGGSLSEGTLEGTSIKCPKHGSQFDLKTGKCIGQAKIMFMKMNVKDAKSYRTEVRGNEVFVEIN